MVASVSIQLTLCLSELNERLWFITYQFSPIKAGDYRLFVRIYVYLIFTVRISTIAKVQQ